MNTAVDFPYLLDTDRVTTWYYRDAPAIGAVVMYANEVYIDTVERVTLTHVWLRSGRALRRPYITSRIVVWSIHKYRTRKHRQSNRQWIDMPKPSMSGSAPRISSNGSRTTRPSFETLMVGSSASAT